VECPYNLKSPPPKVKISAVYPHSDSPYTKL